MNLNCFNNHFVWWKMSKSNIKLSINYSNLSMFVLNIWLQGNLVKTKTKKEEKNNTEGYGDSEFLKRSKLHGVGEIAHTLI